MARKKTSTRTRRTTGTRAARRGSTRTQGSGSGARAPRGGGRTERSGRSSPTKRTAERAGARGSGGLSRSTLRAKWVESLDEHEDYPGQTLATRKHDVIRRWAEERGAIPATVPGTEHDGRPGVLTFDFPGYGGERLRHISWEEWFRTFDERNLVFLFQEHLKSGRPSNHFNFDNPEREAA